MSKYRIVENEQFSQSEIKQDLFGLNYVLSSDFEFSGNQELLDLLADLGPETLRFPGGSVTESYFTEASFLTGDWNANTYVDSYGNVQKLTTISEFMETAGYVGAGVQLVIPTRVAFELSAGQALANGSYGGRTEIAPEYFQQVKAFINKAILEANSNGTAIERFEIGNEFWGSGEMSAGEYGFLAARLTKYLSLEYPEIDIVAQVASSANKFSPRYDRVVFLEPDGSGDYHLHFESDSSSTSPTDWLETVMSGSGKASTQVRLIADQFKAVEGAVNSLSGITEHVYFDAGFEWIDNQRDYALISIYRHFIDQLGVNEIDYHITEWGVRNPRSSNVSENLGNANGLQYAHTTIEGFFELASNGIDGANFWPLTYGNPAIKGRVLINTLDEELTFGGVAFSWLAESTTGLQALFDYEVVDEIDIHGFGDNDRLVLFVGERGGQTHLGELSESIEINFGEFSIANEYFVLVSTLTSDDGSFANISASPDVTYHAGFQIHSNTINLDLDAWELARVEIQKVSELSDKIYGGSGDDQILSRGGDDYITGEAGNDILHGGMGNDTLFGNAGDDFISGGAGEDKLVGGAGDDTLQGGANSDYLNGGPGDDVLYAGEGSGNLVGGTGADEFHFVRNESAAIMSILDFEIGIDSIYIDEQLLNLSDPSSYTENTSITGGENIILLKLEAHYSLFIQGLGLDDVIEFAGENWPSSIPNEKYVEHCPADYSSCDFL